MDHSQSLQRDAAELADNTHHPLSGADMLLQEAEDRKAAALKGSEQARLATEQKLASLQGQIDAVLNGFAELFPGEGWTTGEHPELGNMTEEFASSVVSRVQRLLKSHALMLEGRDSEHNAAKLSVAIANLRAGRLRKFLDPTSLGRTWFECYREYSVSHGMPTRNWEALELSERTEIIAIAEAVTLESERLQKDDDKAVDAMIQRLLDEGDELGSAIRKLIVFTEGTTAVWNVLVHFLRMLSAAGVDVLPPGTIVHGVSTSPHRPE